MPFANTHPSFPSNSPFLLFLWVLLKSKKGLPRRLLFSAMHCTGQKPRYPLPLFLGLLGLYSRQQLSPSMPTCFHTLCNKQHITVIFLPSLPGGFCALDIPGILSDCFCPILWFFLRKGILIKHMDSLQHSDFYLVELHITGQTPTS